MGKKKESNLRFTGKDAWMGSYAGKGEEKQLHKDLQKRYGIQAPYTVKMDSGRAQEALSSRKMYNARINAAINSDYDVRRTLEAKALSGDADAREFAEGGIKGISQVNEVHQMFKKDHKARGNNPDDFGSQSDYSQMTMAAVDKDRKKQTEKYQDMFASKEDLARVKSVEEQMEEAKPYEPSEKVKAAKERVSNYQTGDTSSTNSIFGGGDGGGNNNVFTSGDGEDQRTQASDALAKYKLNLR